MRRAAAANGRIRAKAPRTKPYVADYGVLNVVRQPMAKMPFSIINHPTHGHGIRINGSSPLSVINVTLGGFWDVTGGTASFYSTNVFPLHPEMFNTQLENIAECYQFYRFNKAALRNITGVNLGSNGNYTMAYYADPIMYTDKPGDMMQTPGSLLAPYALNSTFSAGPALHESNDGKPLHRYVNTVGGIIGASSDTWRQCIQGVFCGAPNLGGATGNLMQVMIDYDISFYGLMPSLSSVAPTAKRGDVLAGFKAAMSLIRPPPAATGEYTDSPSLTREELLRAAAHVRLAGAGGPASRSSSRG